MRVLNQITFEAKDDAEALKLASERLGKDAVILSTRMIRMGGFMGLFQRNALQVSAGILQDDSKPEKKEKEKDDAAAKERLVAFQKLLEFKQATEIRSNTEARNNEEENKETQSRMRRTHQENSQLELPLKDTAAKIIYSPASVSTTGKPRGDFDSIHLSQAGLANTARTATDTQTLPAGNGGTGFSKLREDVDSLSKRIDVVLRRLEGPEAEPLVKPESEKNGNDKFEPGIKGISQRDIRADDGMEDIYSRLILSEVEPAYALALVKEYRERKASEPFVKWLGSRIKCAADINSDALGGKRIMLFGPTGAGKTTTIAKLAAIQALWEHKNVLLLTSDTYRIAAVDQLRTYAKILGVPIEVIFEMENFAHIMAEHADAELILLDTAGRGQKNRKTFEAFETLYSVFKPDAVHLVLAANMKYKDMLDVIERMSGVSISNVIFTKLDETVSYGALFNLQKLLNLPISFFTTGQNVPNDIEVATGERLANLLMGDEIGRVSP